MIRLKDILSEEVVEDIDFVNNRMNGAAKITQNAKEKGGDALLTYHHFVVKLPYYEKAKKGEMDIDSAKKWRDQGVYIQMNLNSLTGHYGPEVKNQAEKLIDHKLVDFVGTDCHRMDHLMLLEKNLNLKYFQELSELDLKNSSL